MVLAITATYMVAQALGGWLTGSLALVADAGHMLTDVLGLVMALAAIRVAQRPATGRRTYGFYRTEILAAVANGLVLFGVAGVILVEAWHRLTQTVPPELHTGPMLAVAVGGLVVNLVGVRLLHSGAQESLNLRGAFLEALSDLLGSLGVVVAAIIIALTGWWQADPVVSILIGLFILPRTWNLLRSSLDVLLESTPHHIDVAAMERALASVPGVQSVHDLHVWTITSGFVAMSGHVLADSRRGSDVLHDLRLVLRDQFGIQHATLQVERTNHQDDGACCDIKVGCTIPAASLKMEAAHH
jgi:cobalt-zinc-cadmium efflux system protein